MMRSRYRETEGWAEMLGLNSDQHIERAFLDCNVQSDGARRTNRAARAISRVELQRAMAHVYSRQNKSDQEMTDVARVMIASVQRRQPTTPCAADGAAGRVSYKEFRSGFKGETDLHPAQKQLLAEWRLADRVRFLRSWSWQLPFGQVLWLPIPMLLPVLFGPALFWIARLVATCRTYSRYNVFSLCVCLSLSLCVSASLCVSMSFIHIYRTAQVL